MPLTEIEGIQKPFGKGPYLNDGDLMQRAGIRKMAPKHVIRLEPFGQMVIESIGDGDFKNYLWHVRACLLHSL